MSAECPNVSLEDVVSHFFTFSNVTADEEDQKSTKKVKKNKVKHKVQDRSEKSVIKLQPEKSTTKICDWLVLKFLEKSGLHQVKDKLLRYRTVKPEADIISLLESWKISSLKDLLANYGAKSSKTRKKKKKLEKRKKKSKKLSAASKTNKTVDVGSTSSNVNSQRENSPRKNLRKKRLTIGTQTEPLSGSFSSDHPVNSSHDDSTNDLRLRTERNPDFTRNDDLANSNPSKTNRGTQSQFSVFDQSQSHSRSTLYVERSHPPKFYRQEQTYNRRPMTQSMSFQRRIDSNENSLKRAKLEILDVVDISSDEYFSDHDHRQTLEEILSEENFSSDQNQEPDPPVPTLGLLPAQTRSRAVIPRTSTADQQYSRKTSTPITRPNDKRPSYIQALPDVVMTSQLPLAVKREKPSPAKRIIVARIPSAFKDSTNIHSRSIASQENIQNDSETSESSSETSSDDDDDDDNEASTLSTTQTTTTSKRTKPTICLLPYLNGRTTQISLYWRKGLSRLTKNDLTVPPYAIFNPRPPPPASSSDEDSSDDGRIIPKDLSSYLRAPIPVPVVHPRPDLQAPIPDPIVTPRPNQAAPTRPSSNQAGRPSAQSSGQLASSGQIGFRQSAHSRCRLPTSGRLSAIASKIDVAHNSIGDCRFYQTGTTTTQAHDPESNRTIAHTTSHAVTHSALNQSNTSTSSQMRPGVKQTCTTRTSVTQNRPQSSISVASGSNQITRPLLVPDRPGLNTIRSAKKTVQKLGTSRTLGVGVNQNSRANVTQIRAGPLKPNSSSDSSSSDDDQPQRPPRKLEPVPTMKVTQTTRSKDLTLKQTSTKESAVKQKGTSGSSRKENVPINKVVVTKADGSYSYEDWVPIQIGYFDLYQHLHPEESEVDKLVKYILDQNIPVRYLNVAYSNRTTVGNDVDGMNAVCPMFRHLRFTTGVNGDDGKIVKGWKEVVKQAKIKNPLKCLEALRDSKYFRIAIKKKSVVGCYLGQDLSYVRLATSIFDRAYRLLTATDGGKFSKKEDLEILKGVSDGGAQKSTWVQLAEKFGRSSEAIRSRYNTLKVSDYISGKWTLEEDEICLNILFKGKTSSPEVVNSVGLKELQPVADALTRHVNLVTHHWEGRLKPILLSYHHSASYKNFKIPFFTNLIERKVAAFQEIDWRDVKRQFPTQTTTSLTFELHNQVMSLDVLNPHEIDLPLFVKLKNNISLWKDETITEITKKYRENIINLYDKIRRLRH